MRNVCLIPARSGSKGLKDKNMAFLNNKPVLQHTIEAALESGIFEPKDIYLSTDSQDYIRHLGDLPISIKYRDPQLASDSATTADVVVDYLKEFEGQDVNLILLQPTSPLRTGQHIAEAFELFLANQRNNQVVSISEVDKSPNLFTELGPNGELQDIVGVDKGYRRQNHAKLFAPNGAIFITTMSDYLATTSFFTEKSIGYQMDKKASIDIDDYEDFVKAIGAIFFDYNRRESANKEMYQTMFRDKYSPKITNLIIGDSRTVPVEIEGYDNLSMGGVTATTMLDICKAEVVPESIQNIIINLGINDIIVGYSLEQIKSSIEDLINYFEKSNITLINIFPTIYRPNVKGEIIVELNNYFKSFNNINILDAYSLLEENGKLNFDYTVDGLHLSEAANSKFEQFIKNNI